jgi:hypothetical protein
VQFVTTTPAFLLQLSDVGQLCPMAQADFLAVHNTNDDALCKSRRGDLSLIVKGGIPQIGDPHVMMKFPHIQTVAATLDGKPKSIHVDLARRIHQCTLKEPGLEVDAVPTQRRIFSLW